MHPDDHRPEGRIGPVERSSGGRRRHSEDDIAWIGLPTCLRDAGLDIADLHYGNTATQITKYRRWAGGGGP